MPPGGELLVTLRWKPRSASDRERQAEVYVEDVDGRLHTFTLATRGP